MNELNVVISQANETDANGIQLVLKESSRKMYLDCGYSDVDFEKRFKDSLSEDGIAKCTENIRFLSEDEKFLVAKHNEQVVGIFYVEKCPDNNTLHALHVLPDFQGKGVGTLLWNEGIDFLDPSKDTFLEVFSCNKKAIDFYEKKGFVSSGEISINPSFRSESGVEIEEIKMILKGR